MLKYLHGKFIRGKYMRQKLSDFRPGLRMKMTHRRFRQNFGARIFILLIFLISSCTSPAIIPTSPPPDTPAPVLEPTQTPTAVEPTIVPTLQPEAACEYQQQMQAVRSGLNFDWNRITPYNCYDLTLILMDEADTHYSGTARITFTNQTIEPLPDLVFRTYANADVIFGGNLVITSAEVNGIPVEPELLLEDGTAYRLLLPQMLQPGATITAFLEFTGRVPENFGSPNVYGTFNLSRAEPILSLASWYPILAVLENGEWQVFPVSPVGDVVVSEIAFYRVLIDAPADWQVAATGALTSQSADPARTTHEFVSGPVRDFMIVASPVFTTEEVLHGDIRLVHWRLPGIEYDGTSLEVAGRSIDLFTERFGPYPYSQLDIVDIPLQNASGVEYPGLIILATTLYSDPTRRDFLPTVVAHEVGHQWWYAVVGGDVNQHPWQDEGLTTFSTLLYHEEYDLPYYQGTIEFYRQRVASYEQEFGPQPVGQPVTAFTARDSGYAIVVYYKGALFFVDLREQIGEEAFFSALSSYYSAGKFRIVSPYILLNLFEHACECDLSDFYRAYGAIYP
jgi:hypothetical protein